MAAAAIHERRLHTTDSLCPSISSILQSENFQKMSSNIITRVDEMGKRLGDLERLIEDLQSTSSVAPPPLPLGDPDDTTQS